MASTVLTARPEGRYTTAEACRLTGASYRQVDYWRRTTPAIAHDLPGSGERSWLSEAQVMRIDLMHRLVAAGITVEAARRLVDENEPGATVQVKIGEGIVLALRWRTLPEMAE